MTNTSTSYGLQWNKQDAPPHLNVLLKEDENRRIHKRKDAVDNYLIEGDNIHALRKLQETHKGKVDVIYIDPPYNTGNKGFVYNDNFYEKGDKHSAWLNFMNDRLLLAKELLSDEGVIFISIGDDEQANLKLLCDQVFGKQNFIENMIWTKNAGNNNSMLSSTKHEYLICYAKKKNNLDSSFFNIKKRGYDEVVKITEMGARNETSPMIVQNELREFYNKNKTSLTKGIIQYKYVDEEYAVFQVDNLGNPSNTALNNPDYNYTLTHPLSGEKLNMPKRGWLYKREVMIQKILNNEIYLDSKVPRLKRYLADVKEQNASSVIPNNDNGITELKDVFTTNNIVFNNPKPTSLIRYLIELHPNPNAIIFDFFAGSGTTGHAVMELNKEDGGNRQFILCTSNENNICKEITYERLKRVINGYTTPKGKKIEGIPNNLIYYKIETSI